MIEHADDNTGMLLPNLGLILYTVGGIAFWVLVVYLLYRWFRKLTKRHGTAA